MCVPPTRSAPAWKLSACRYAARPAARDEHRHGPGDARRPRPRPASARRPRGVRVAAVRAIARNGNVSDGGLRPDADRRARRAALPPSSGRPDGVPATSASTHIDRGEPEHVAERTQRGEPEQRRRPPATSVAHHARSSRPSSRRKNRNNAGNRGGAGERAPDRQPARRRGVHAGGAQHRGRHLRQRDEDGIAGRMRLMPRDVELADAEREIDRVEVLERPGQKARGARARKIRSSATPADRWRSHSTGRSLSASFRLPRR